MPYNQIRFPKSDEEKIGFYTTHRYFKYQVIPLDLSNSLGSFQGYINKIFAEKLDIFVIIYLADIVVYIKDYGKSHVDMIHYVLE